MSPHRHPLTPEPPLSEFTEQVRTAPQLDWYRSPLPPGQFKALHERSNLRGAVQTIGHLAIFGTTGTVAYLAAGRLPWWQTAALVFAHGMVASFFPNAVHELGHGTVFKSKRLNTFFCHVFAFFGWINHEMFQTSHVRHHRYTLHPPDDLEVVLPVRLMVRDFLLQGFVSWRDFRLNVGKTLRIACGRFRGEWESTLYPANEPARRIPPVRWARVMLVGHLAVLAFAAATGHWLLPVLVTLPAFYGGWLFWLCNNTQHVGLCDYATDFRLCCRTFTLNPAVRFLYWQMNYHIEHHMYAAVPCYHLGKLHRLVAADLPPTPDGIVAVWREIAGLLRQQAKNPSFRYTPIVPPRN